MFTISRAAELTGVPVATLRAWERRYGVVDPHRTDGGYRLYDDGALARIAAMRDLVAGGWSPRQAADHVLASGGSPALEPVPASSAGVARPVGVVGPDAGGDAAGAAADAVAPPGADLDLLAAARDVDPARLGAVLDDRFARGSFESVVDGWLMPALQAVGDAWARGDLSTAAEHLVAHAVLRRLSAAYEAAGVGATGPSVLVGLAPGSRHELGALAFATAARRAGLAVTYLGADLPIDSWCEAVAHRQPGAVVVPVPRRRDVPAVVAVLDAVRAAAPGVRLVVGGGEQDRVSGDVHRLGHRIGPAAAGLAAALNER